MQHHSIRPQYRSIYPSSQTDTNNDLYPHNFHDQNIHLRLEGTRTDAANTDPNAKAGASIPVGPGGTDPNLVDDIVIEQKPLTAGDRMTIRMAAGGGFAVRLEAIE